jgi:hypothetical protein
MGSRLDDFRKKERRKEGANNTNLQIMIILKLNDYELEICINKKQSRVDCYQKPTPPKEI